MKAMLSGFRVLDFTQGHAGPYATRLMALHGAEVVKVEPPGRGDIARACPPFIEAVDGSRLSATFLHLNAGKRSVTLDLESERGRAVAVEMARRGEVVVLDFCANGVTAGALELRRQLREANPDAVLLSLSPFGLGGPRMKQSADELTIAAMGGVLWAIGEPAREPLKPGPPLLLYAAGLLGAIGTMGALISRLRKGQAPEVEVSLLEAAICCTDFPSVVYSYTKETPRRRKGNTFPFPIFRCKDGYVTVIIINEGEWERLCGMIDRIDLLNNDSYATPVGRQRHAELVMAELAPWFLTRAKRELFRLGMEWQVPVAVVMSPDDTLRSRQFRFRGFLRDVGHPLAGSLASMGPASAFRDEHGTLTVPGLAAAPAPGEDNRSVYHDLLGWDETALAGARANGLV